MWWNLDSLGGWAEYFLGSPRVPVNHKFVVGLGLLGGDSWVAIIGGKVLTSLIATKLLLACYWFGLTLGGVVNYWWESPYQP